MLIFHCADTHLGHRMFNKTVPLDEEDAGLNQREADIYNAWDRLVQEAIQINPDVFIHAGDFFDSVTPSNRAIVRARDGLYKLSEAGIKSVILAGNHETPRLSETGHVFSLLERIPDVSVMYDGKPQLDKCECVWSFIKGFNIPLRSFQGRLGDHCTWCKKLRYWRYFGNDFA